MFAPKYIGAANQLGGNLIIDAQNNIAGLQSGKAQPEVNTDQGDKTGPVSIAVAVTTPAPPADATPEDPKTPPQTRSAVFGDSDFASDAWAGSIGNVDLFLNTVSWLTAQENLISIRPKEPGDSRLAMTPEAVRLVNWASLLVIPALVLAGGIVVWARRRAS